jgi:HEAT repeat protein
MGEKCPICGTICDSPAMTYEEKLLETVLSKDSTRAGMAVDVLTKLIHEPRTILPLFMLLEKENDPYPLVLGARGLGWLGDITAVPSLVKLLLDEDKPYVARIAAAEALSTFDNMETRQALEQAKNSRRPSVARAAVKSLEMMEKDKSYGK